MLSLIKAFFEILGISRVIAALVILPVVVVFAPGVALSKGIQGKGVINAWVLNVRAQPSSDSNVVGTLKKEEPVRVIGGDGGEGGWLEIQSAAVHGFVRNRPKYILWKPDKGHISQAQKRSIKEAGKEAEEIRQKIAVKENEVQEFTEKETAMIEGLNEIELSLDRMRARISILNDELETVKNSMVRVLDEKKILEASIDRNKDYVGARLKALYQVRMIGRMALSSMPDSMCDFFVNQNALEKILEADLELLDKQMADMDHLAAASREFESLEKEKKQLEATLMDEIRVKKMEIEKRSAILGEIQQKKKLGLAVVASLKQAAEELEKKMAAFQSGAPGVQEGFSLRRGRLEMPVKGKIITAYGPSQDSNYSSFTFQTGIDIRVERGEPVRSVFKGEVLYAEWLKGYGNLIIINHGDSFYTLYAHVEEFFKKKGERVDTSEVIALAGDTGSIKGTCLHFEVRHHGKPVNPMIWLKKGA